VYLHTTNTIEINIPLVKSSQLTMWPILGAFVNQRHISPFIIGVYCGYGSPKSINEYLADFVDEIKHINANEGIFVHNRKINFSLRCF
jgi:hypothetical protein